jgi:uncharacterized membrane protein (Fun14 family)
MIKRKIISYTIRLMIVLLLLIPVLILGILELVRYGLDNFNSRAAKKLENFANFVNRKLIMWEENTPEETMTRLKATYKIK